MDPHAAGFALDYFALIHYVLYVHYSFFVLVSFIVLASSSLVAFTIRLKFYYTPFAPVPAITQQQPFNFALSLFTSHSLFPYDAALLPAGLVFIRLSFTFPHYSHFCIKVLVLYLLPDPHINTLHLASLKARQ